MNRTAVDGTISLLRRVGRTDEAIALMLPLATAIPIPRPGRGTPIQSDRIWAAAQRPWRR